MALRYTLPDDWIRYDVGRVVSALLDAKAAILSLRTIPYQRAWVEALQKMEFKREVAGTSRIEGAELTERELDAALARGTEALRTRSQRQARAAAEAYRWIATIPPGQPVDANLIHGIHSRMVTNCDDDHCAPGRLRGADENVTFGLPRHRGVSGGEECRRAFARFTDALSSTFRAHDPLVQALAAHYHLAAMHPYLDGNGRTARALEALLLQRAGLRDACFVSVSNFYYEEKAAYLAALHRVGLEQHDLTEFLLFGLRGLEQQTRRLLDEITRSVEKALFRNTMFDLFGRLRSQRKRVIAERQIEILKLLLEQDALSVTELTARTKSLYKGLRSPETAFVRDVMGLSALRAVRLEARGEEQGDLWVVLRPSWPMEVTETEFLKRLSNLPKSKTFSLVHSESDL